jgi:membrane-associated protein
VRDTADVGSVLDALTSLPAWLVLVAVFALPALEASTFIGLVFPGEVAVLVGGVVAHGGALRLWEVIVAAAFGAALGDQIGFVVGRRYGQALLTRLPPRLRRPDETARALELVKRRGAIAVVLGRWAAALRALVPGIAGMSGMSRPQFTIANLTGGTIWAVAIALAGYLAGASYRLVASRLGLAGDVIAALVVLGIIAYLVLRRRRHSNRRT